MLLNDEMKKARQILFMTGAGVSTASGIPDYRSKNGLYSKKENPEYLLSRTCLLENPELFYNFVTHKMYYPDAQPNIIHQKIAEATKKENAFVITQNVDGLHTAAGAENILEFHGSLKRVYCQKCRQKVAYQDYLRSMYHENCGGILRPDIILYEEKITPKIIEKAIAFVSKADLIIVCGTSLRVYPFAGLLEYRNKSAKLVAINREKLQMPIGSTQLITDASKIFAQLSF
ncbi:NAD-dependent protein deacylase [Liquorilactobacillus oeni]|uniref:protein acetyllysine N-acetyltransferase n=1 Tax=Liquorilactobacillus oeni DSM 19972 TaxID=1423777 RepID=A0A0R1MDT3_9LACO|nr:NAD-dependent protein deacylase [Liquorilactobacillus oeni]KRL06188.1 sir2 family protein [Liquorilactobacillus oeni DSM 19972]